MEENTKIEENLFFTEITENEKRIVNLMRTYIAPYQDPSSFFDDIVEGVAHKLLTKAIRLQAFAEVLGYERQSDKSNLEILARVDMFEDYLKSRPEVVERLMASIMSDMVHNIEGDIKPITVYSKQEAVQEEEKLLDKINQM